MFSFRKRYKVEYVESGRSGNIIYRESGNSVSFYWEFGGADNVILIISLPDAATWDKNFPWANGRRMEICKRVAEAAAKDKCSNCYAEYDEKHGDYLVISRSR